MCINSAKGAHKVHVLENYGTLDAPLEMIAELSKSGEGYDADIWGWIEIHEPRGYHVSGCFRVRVLLHELSFFPRSFGVDLIFLFPISRFEVFRCSRERRVRRCEMMWNSEPLTRDLEK
jgi:hypothetical protein